MLGNRDAGVGGKRENNKIDEAAAVVRTVAMGLLNTVKAGDNTKTKGGGPAACCVPNATGTTANYRSSAASKAKGGGPAACRA